ncbi:hypothetical protein HPT25_27385 [Bacillus sp. BRMEA1]|uniref:hypothetical protein n=1 Tax=Neobacillus endophyticus TaxID=2738405 RepID=UPI0015644728|nr:hypothetical protein [Neobacillus endophyticus]NRD81045.1 hypothetical protein [Neobacillus endophyticus]
MLEFDISKFEAHLQFRDKTSKGVSDKSGFINVIRFMWNHYPLEEIDFTSFSYNDVLKSLDAMDELPLTQLDDSDEYFFVDPHNPFMAYASIEDAIARLYHDKNKQFHTDDEIIFI